MKREKRKSQRGATKVIDYRNNDEYAQFKHNIQMIFYLNLSYSNMPMRR